MVVITKSHKELAEYIIIDEIIKDMKLEDLEKLVNLGIGIKVIDQIIKNSKELLDKLNEISSVDGDKIISSTGEADHYLVNKDLDTQIQDFISSLNRLYSDSFIKPSGFTKEFYELCKLELQSFPSKETYTTEVLVRYLSGLTSNYLKTKVTLLAEVKVMLGGEFKLNQVESYFCSSTNIYNHEVELLCGELFEAAKD